MPTYRVHFRQGAVVSTDAHGIEFPDLHQAYLETCRTIPDMARDVLIEGKDPMTCAFIICDGDGRHLMEVPFTERLPLSRWRRRRAQRGPHTGFRSDLARDDLALSSFRRMFGAVNAGCVLMTPELEVREMTEFGARHSHVDPEAIRGTSILDIFAGLKGEPKRDFTKFMNFARTGVVSEVVDLPYLVLDEKGETADGWWNARVWPIFDDDDRIIGLVEWAEPFTSPTASGNTNVRVGTQPLVR